MKNKLVYDSEKWYYIPAYKTWYRTDFVDIGKGVKVVKNPNEIDSVDSSVFDKKNNKPKSEDDIVQVDFFSAFDRGETYEFFKLMLKAFGISADGLKIEAEGHPLHKSTETLDTLLAIKQVVDFDKVSGLTDNFDYDLSFSKNAQLIFTLKGKYNENDEMPTTLNVIGKGSAVFNGYETSGMGDFSISAFLRNFLRAYNKVQPIFSSVIAYEGYAIADEIGTARSREQAEEMLSIMKGKLSYHIVEGEQIPNKLVGKTWQDDEQFKKGGTFKTNEYSIGGL